MRRRIFAFAVVASLLIHLGVLGQPGLMLATPAPEVVFPIQANLNLPEPERVPTPIPSLEPPPPASPVAAPAAKPEPPPAILPLPLPEPAAPAPLPPPAVVPQPSSAPPAAAAAEPVVGPAPPPVPPPRRLRALPASLTLTYDVASGDDGFKLGQAVYRWQAEGERYTLQSEAAATGLVSLFVSGQITQRSEGRIGPFGLIPERFTQTRGNRRQENAVFDWPAREIDMDGRRQALEEGAQDILSFPFHLAMTLRDEDTRWTLAVSNGRKLHAYDFEAVGPMKLELGGQAVETVHIRAAREGSGQLEVWVAVGRHGLPVRIRTLDQKGKVVLLTLAQ